MRVLLDAHFSPKRIGVPLESAGHDVLSLAADLVLGALDDLSVLQLAADESRILITRNGRDFVPLLREWADLGRHHSGCILVWTLGHHEFGAIVSGVGGLLASRPDAADWHDTIVAL